MIKNFLSVFLVLSMATLCFGNDFHIDADFPGGNIVVESVKGNVVHVHQDMKDSSGSWFYWAFRVTGAQGRTVEFVFTKRPPLTTRGPAFSHDGGKTWQWLGPIGQKRDRFTFAFGPADNDVRFSVGIPYNQKNLEQFLKNWSHSPWLKKETLIQSVKNRPIELIRVSDFQSEKPFEIILTGTHHACEQIALYVAEGLVATALSETETGRQLRKMAEIRFIPFMDKDGVEDGDQGKDRRPHDHNRDYIQEIYPSVKALKKMVADLGSKSGYVFLDFHCPELYDDFPNLHQTLFFTPPLRDDIKKNMTEFVALVEKNHKGKLPFVASRAIAGQTFINDMKTQKTYSMWGGEQPGALLAATLEVPYGNIEGHEAQPDSLRLLGQAFAQSLVQYLTAVQDRQVAKAQEKDAAQ